MCKLGFTLIELLVVIAIIGILAAILFPVFSRAKEAAKKSACLSNSKQLAIGVLLYAQDCDDVLPPTQNGDAILWPDLLSPYVRSAAIRTCPDDVAAKNSYGLNELLFLDFTDYLPGVPTTVPNLGTVQVAASTIMLGELGTGDDLKSPRSDAFKLTVPDGSLNDAYDARPAARHFQQANLAYFDGHAASKPLNRFYTGQVPADRYFCADATETATCMAN